MCVCEFRIQINNNNNLTYKAATTNNEFFKQISKAPCVHAIFKRYRTRPVIVFVAYTRQYKEAIHDQDYDEHPLNEEKSLFCVFCCFFLFYKIQQILWVFYVTEISNFQQTFTVVFTHCYMVFFSNFVNIFFFIPRFSINMQEVFVDKLFFKKLIYYFAKKKTKHSIYYECIFTYVVDCEFSSWCFEILYQFGEQML